MVHRVPTKGDSNRIKDILIKMKKAKDEQTARSKKERTYKGNSIIFRAYLPNETQ